MMKHVEYSLAPGRLRLEAVMPGVIRCVHTLNDRILPPSPLVDALPEGDFPCELLPDGLRAGDFTARFDRDTGRLTWLDGERTLLSEGPHLLTPKPLVRYTTGGAAPVVERVKTVDGERSFIKNLVPEAVGTVFEAVLRFSFAEDEGIYGLGQGECGVWNWRGRTQYLYQHNMRIPMPFFLSDRGYGLFVDCGSLMVFEGDALRLDAVDQLDYYVITGSFDAIIARLRTLTGRAPLLPRWAFGYIQSKERYETAAELLQVAAQYRALGVPLDGIVQDWHTWREGRWGEKRLDPERYGDLHQRMDALHALHVHAMVSVWPNMNQGTADHTEFMEAGKLLNDLSTYDAFDPDARAMYWRQAKAELFDGGFDAWWCDSTEPFSGPDWGGETLRPEAERFDLVGGEHKKYLDPRRANLYAVAHAKGIYENQRHDAPDMRVLNLTRSGYVSGQRYGAVLWSGDICARWDVMKAQIAEALNMAASGYPWWTLDIGGFFVVHENWRGRGCGCNGDPTPKWFWRGDFEAGIDDPGYRELYVRWLQFGGFLPMFRSHGTDTPREIWQFGVRGTPFFDAIEKAIRLRYRLMPYIYSLAGGVWRENGMMVRPLLFDFPNDPRARACATEYLFGPALLVCPVTEPMRCAPGGAALHREPVWECYLPEGCDWYDFWDDTRYPGGQAVTVPAPLDRMPLFVRAGAILPMAEGLQYADQVPDGPMEIRVYPGADGRFDLYEDAGNGYDYENGAYTVTRLEWDDEKGVLTPLREDMRLTIIGR